MKKLSHLFKHQPQFWISQLRVYNQLLCLDLTRNHLVIYFWSKLGAKFQRSWENLPGHCFMQGLDISTSHPKQATFLTLPLHPYTCLLTSSIPQQRLLLRKMDLISIQDIDPTCLSQNWTTFTLFITPALGTTCYCTSLCIILHHALSWHGCRKIIWGGGLGELIYVTHEIKRWRSLEAHYKLS